MFKNRLRILLNQKLGLGSEPALEVMLNTKALRLSPVWGEVACSFVKIYFWPGEQALGCEPHAHLTE